MYVCVCVWPSPRDLGNETSYRHTPFAGVKRFSWRVAQTAFQAYTTRGSRGKMFGTFWPVKRWSPGTHVTLPGYPGQDESCSLLERCWSILEGHRYHSWYSRRLRVEEHTREWVTEEEGHPPLNRLQRKVSKVTRGRTCELRRSLEGYVLDTPVNVLQRKDTPANGLQRKVDYTIQNLS